MLNWLLLLWRKTSAWMMPGPAAAADHDPVSESYRPSKLQARHFRWNRVPSVLKAGTLGRGRRDK
jgi:hypothetical protein